MSNNYLIGAKCTHLDEPGLYKDYKRIMTWSQFVANNYTNNQVERLCLPSGFVGDRQNAINCPNLTELYSEDEVFKCDTNSLAYIPSALKTTVDGSTYININQNPYYVVSNIGSNTSIEDGCVVLPGLIGTTITTPLNTLYVPDSVKYIGAGSNLELKCSTLNIVGNEDLEIESLALPISDDNNVLESLTVSKADKIGLLSIDAGQNPPSDPSDLPLLSSVSLNAREVHISGGSNTINMYVRYLRRINLGSDLEVADIDWMNYSLTEVSGFNPTHFGYAGTGAQWYAIATNVDSDVDLRRVRVYCTDGYYEYDDLGDASWHTN